MEAFLEMLAAERGAAGNTIEAYGRDLAHYGAALAGRGRSVIAGDSDDLRAYLADLTRAGLYAATCAAAQASAFPV